jgi:hypothetical protein
MRERIAGCLICLVAMLTWEALSASSHETVRIPPPAVQSGPLVELSQGIVGGRSEENVLLASADPADAAVFEWVEELLPVVAAAPCQPVLVASCETRRKRAPGGQSDDDAGVGPSASQMSSVTPGGKSG